MEKPPESDENRRKPWIQRIRWIPLAGAAGIILVGLVVLNIARGGHYSLFDLALGLVVLALVLAGSFDKK